MPSKRRRVDETGSHAPFARPVAPGAALVAPVVASIFQELRISVAVWTKKERLPEEWYPIHITPNVTSFEIEHSVNPQRYAYNYRSFERVLRTRAPLLGTHAGFKDLFLPIADTREVRRVLVAGPFAVSPPTSAEILARWYGITRTRGRLSEPAFAQYVSATLSTLTLDGPLLESFRSLLSIFGRLVSDEGAPTTLAAQAEAMRLELFEARFAERMWETARALVDDRKARTLPANYGETLKYLGVKRVPEHVVAGVLVATESEPDPLLLLLRCHGFQRACADAARRMGNVLAGQAGDHGVFWLTSAPGSHARKLSSLEDLARRASGIARRFGLRLYAGASVAHETALPVRYRAALASAERAAAQRRSIVYDEPPSERGERALAKLRRSLPHGIESRPELLSARFEEYVEAAVAHAGRRIESLKSELDAGLERLTEPLLSIGALDEKSFDEMRAAMAQMAAEASNESALLAPYRKLVLEIQSAVVSPIGARQDRGTRRAVSFIRDHLSEPLTLSMIARVAGFAPGYFSKRFKRNEGMTFQRYTLVLRIERAAEMLSGTRVSVERVRQLTGFRTRAHFNRAFKQAMGASPSVYRQRKQSKHRRASGYEQRPLA